MLTYYSEARLPRAIGSLLVSAAAVLCANGPATGQTAEQIPVETFAQLPSVSDMKFSPSGEFLAIIRPFQGRNALIVQRRIPREGEEPAVLASPEPSRIQWVEWKTDDLLLLGIEFAGVRYGTPVMETRMLAVDRETMKAENIVRGEKTNTTGSRVGGLRSVELQAQLQDEVIDFLRSEPDYILQSIDADLNGKDEVRRVNVTNGAYREVGLDFEGVQLWYADRQGELRLGVGFNIATDKQVILYRSPENGEWHSLDNVISSGRNLRPLAFTDDPAKLYMRGYNQFGRAELVVYDTASGQVEQTIFSHETYDLGGLLTEERTDRVVGYYYTEDRRKYVYFDPDWNRRQRIIDGALKGFVNRIVSSTTDGNLHLILSTSDIESGFYYVYDEKRKRIDPVVSTYNGLDPNLMSPVKAIRYTTADDVEITAYLTIPRGSDGKNLPTVLFPHGGPHARDYVTYDAWAQFLASRGYAVLQPNFRGSSGYGNAFQNAGWQKWGGRMQDDLTDGAKWLIAQGIADPDRICIAGISYGGYAALMGPVKAPDMFQCVIAINGVADLGRLIDESKRYIGGRTMATGIGDADTPSEQLKAASPYYHVDKLKVPLLLIHAKDDRTVDYRQSTRLSRQLKREDIDHRYLEIDDGGHSLQTHKSRIEVMREMESFLARHLASGS